jgi:hypothetical protein
MPLAQNCEMKTSNDLFIILLVLCFVGLLVLGFIKNMTEVGLLGGIVLCVTASFIGYLVCCNNAGFTMIGLF